MPRDTLNATPVRPVVLAAFAAVTFVAGPWAAARAQSEAGTELFAQAQDQDRDQDQNRDKDGDQDRDQDREQERDQDKDRDQDQLREQLRDGSCNEVIEGSDELREVLRPCMSGDRVLEQGCLDRLDLSGPKFQRLREACLGK